ncbi:MAG: hypothetical protein JWM57_1330, partial [Phycisphaerales bacterium]|nr:hypothetical protein [Phycisphaerales bacterium]
MPQEQPVTTSTDPYAGELTVAELIEEWVANVDSRYVLISSGGTT